MSQSPESNPYASPSQCEPVTKRVVRRPWLVLFIPLVLVAPLWFATRPYVENLPGQHGKPLEDQQRESRLLRIVLIASLSVVYWFGSSLYLCYVGWLRALSIFLVLVSGLLLLPALFALLVFATLTFSDLSARM